MKNVKELTGNEMLNNWLKYEELKKQFIETHPEATVKEIEQYCKKVLRRLGL